MIRLIIILILLTAVELGDGYIASKPEPMVVVELGWTYLKCESVK
jgi:hypothetical protein